MATYRHYFQYLQNWLLTKLQYFSYIIHISIFPVINIIILQL